MPNYQNGKIYTIRNYTDNTLIYVGSTIQSLSRRLSKHRTDCKAGSGIALYSHISDNNWSNWYIELYEYYPCNERAELEKREGEVIREIGTINKCIAGRTRKEWCVDNYDKIKGYWKKSYDNNVEKHIEKNKKFRDNNPEYYKEYTKKYYERNADIVKEKKKEKVCCDICGVFSTKASITRHQKSKKCMDIANKII